MAAVWEARLAAEGLTALEDYSPQAGPRRAQGGTLGEYYAAATWFFEEHSFSDDYERMVWQMHVDGRTNREIARALREAGAEGAYRKRVDLTVGRLKRLMRGRLAGKRGPGRPENPSGYGAESLILQARLNEGQTSALFAIEDRLRGRGMNLSRSDVVRMALIFFARSA